MVHRCVEIFVFTWIACILWLVYLLLHPVLHLFNWNINLRDCLLSWLLYKLSSPVYKGTFEEIKRELFKEISYLKMDCYGPLRILELGVGEGSNLPYYPQNSILTVLDSNALMKRYFFHNIKSYPTITLEGFLVGIAENMKEVMDEDMDVVVCTNVLCSVTDIDNTLKEVKRILVPGGRFYCLEHIAYPKEEWSYKIQKLMDPMWSSIFYGCQLSRCTEKHIMKAGFASVSQRIVEPVDIPLFIRRTLVVTAVK